MNEELWGMIKYFTPEEKWGRNPNKMHRNLVFMLDSLRKFIRKPIKIHCGYEERPSGYHPLGLAVDCHAEGISLFDFYMAASRFGFSGIGIYTWWYNPGLHLDIRQGLSSLLNEPRVLWMSRAPKTYIPVNKENFAEILTI